MFPSKSLLFVFFLASLLFHQLDGLVPEDLNMVAESQSKGKEAAPVIPNWTGNNCTAHDLDVTQGATGPTHTVHIYNVSASGCAISGIHLRCGAFSSDTFIDPKIFRRLGIDDCLVNDGQPIKYGDSISFEYSSNVQYPMDVSAALCGDGSSD